MGKHTKQAPLKKKIVLTSAVLLTVGALIAAYFLIAQGVLFEKKEVKRDIVLRKAGQATKLGYDKVIRILVLGSDSRNSSIKGSRSDGNMLIQLNPDRSADIVSFPRDSYVPIAGGGTRKINSALAFGGPERTVKTVENYSGLKVDYYMVTSFPGFTGLVNAIGGLKFTFDKPLNDRLAGASFSSGTKVLSGGDALAVARSRHIAGGDFTRQANQQKLVIAALKQERKRSNNMGLVLKLVPVLTKRVETDLSYKELFSLLRSGLKTDPNKITARVLQGGSGGGGGGSVVHLNRTYANQVFRQMKAKEGK